MKNQLHINFHLTQKFHRMCKKAGFSAPFSVVGVDNRNSLNATLYLESQIVALTQYDIKHLSEADNDALLAHEAGHLKCYYRNHCKIIDWASVKAGIASLAFIFLSIIIGRNHPNLISVLAMCTFCPIPLFFNASGIHDEYKADVIGTFIVGVHNMIHLLVVANNYEVYQYNQLHKYAKALWICPLSDLYIRWLMFRFRLLYLFQILHCSIHPSYRSRVRCLQKHFKEHIVR